MAGQWLWKVESLAAWPCLPASGLVARPFSPLGLVPRTSHPLHLGLRIRESCTRATDCLPALQSHYAAAVTSSPGDRTLSHPWSFAPSFYWLDQTVWWLHMGNTASPGDNLPLLPCLGLLTPP